MISLKQLFLKKPYDVVFYYPQHFNRSKNGTNPYFDPLIAICQKNNLRYLVLEEPDSKTKYPRNKQARKFDFWFYIILVLRKITPLVFFKNKGCGDEFIGKLISILTLNSFNATTYITISNSMINVLTGFNKNSYVYDLQHGIIYSWHWGYFNENGKLRLDLTNDRIGFLVYGKGFQDVFLKENKFLNAQNGRVKIIGNVLENNSTTEQEFFSRNNIVYTLQITNHLNQEDLLEEKKELVAFIELNKHLFIENNVQLLLKHHPRFNNAIELNDIISNYSFVKLTDKTITELAESVFLNITLASTSIFEFALMGIPSYIIPNAFGQKVFKEEYKYPLNNLLLGDIITTHLFSKSNYKVYCDKVKEWALNFYKPFNENPFFEIINKRNEI